jgi:hypothetical protein
MRQVCLFWASVFLSAFLLLQVQPVIGKCILPWFGASLGVWTTCLLFFQILLLGGYAYAHLLVSRLSPRRQALVHGLLVVAALAVLPITPSPSARSLGGATPAGEVLAVLAVSVGLPYFVLSATAPLLQGWFAQLHPRRSPYRLYALSNAGSLLALLGYPFLVEPRWTLSQQTVRWSLGFGGFALLAGLCAWTCARGRVQGGLPRLDEAQAVGAMPVAPDANAEAGRPSWGDVLLWFALSACGSALLLATTNQMCLDVAVVPFLWVLPLTLYLLSFVLAFAHDRWGVVRPVVLGLLPVGLLRAFDLLVRGVEAPIAYQVLGYGLMLFLACLACHGELARAKPAPRSLTAFYLVVALGGAAGGLLVALGAPAVFDGYAEMPLLLVATYALVLLAAFRPAPGHATPARASAWGRWTQAGLVLGAAAVGGWAGSRMLDAGHWLDLGAGGTQADVQRWFDGFLGWLWVPVVVPFLGGEIRRRVRRVGYVAWWGDLRRNVALVGGVLGCVGLLGLVAACGWVLRGRDAVWIARGRNFYGVLAIREERGGTRWRDWTLRNGRIMHGYQLQAHPDWPTSYYGPLTGVGLAIRDHPRRWTRGRPFRIGVVGLGAGTMAAYANADFDPDASSEDAYAHVRRRDPGDVVRFYELNPLVRDWAEHDFRFLSDARARGAHVDVVMGDARLSLERELAEGHPQRFDVLVIDAFSGDAIPIHLLTRESVGVYLKHLAPGGVLALHVTNRYIDLVPVARALADAYGMEIVHVDTEHDDDIWQVSSCDWLLLTNDVPLLTRLRDVAVALPRPGPLWTDDFSSVFPLVKGSERERDPWAALLDVLRGRFDDDEDD